MTYRLLCTLQVALPTELSRRVLRDSDRLADGLIGDQGSDRNTSAHHASGLRDGCLSIEVHQAEPLRSEQPSKADGATLVKELQV